MKITKRGIIQALILLAILASFVGVTHKKEVNKVEVHKTTSDSIMDIADSLENTQKYIENILNNIDKIENEYTGTIPPFTYTADIVTIDEKSKSIYGITSNKETYSGLMRFDMSDTNIDISNIKLYETYDIKCKPLIRDKEDNKSVTPYVEVISIEESSDEAKDKFRKSKEDLSRYIEFKVTHETDSLENIIQEANEEYYKWSDSDILDYQDWIQSLGYSDNEDIEVKSLVKTIEQLKDEE